LLKTVVTITLSLERFKSFRQRVRKIDLVNNWAVVGEHMSLPVAIISSL